VADEPTRVSLVIPSFRRPDLLARCLAGVRAMERQPDELIVVRRSDDAETERLLTDVVGITSVTVKEPGVLAAMNAGVVASSGGIIAFIDDDAVPRPGWLTALVCRLEDGRVGGIGGRDVVQGPAGTDLQNDGPVGLVTKWGKLIGNHHLGSGPPRDVTVLKAVNMAFRREALALPRALRGSGAQVHFEVAVGLWARDQGWRLVYDPAILVDHYPGPRFDRDRRDRPDPVAARDAAYNLVTCLINLEPSLRTRRALYGLLIGDAMTPGLVRAGLALAQGDREVRRRLLPSLQGQVAALRDYRAGRLIDMVPAQTRARISKG
jgi:glycosyltransferase involved in cell wall biosynthesis